MHPTAPKSKRAYADAPSGQVHYYDSGGGGVPLLMLHQSPTSSMDFFSTFPFFAQAGVRLIAMDTPGMGMSDAPASEPTIGDYADAARAVLDHVGAPKADVIGHHTGAQIAVEAVAKSPDRFRKVVLYGVPLLGAEERQGYWESIVPREREGAMHKPAPGGANLSAQYQRFETYVGAVGAQRMLLSSLMAGPLWWYGHNAALTHDMRAPLCATRHPLLLLSNKGEMFDANTKAAKALRPDAVLVELETEGAIAMDSDPEAFASAVAKFLRAG